MIGRITAQAPRLLVTGLLALSSGPALAGSELSVLGAWSRGDDVSETTTDSESLTLRWITGDRLRFRAYLPFLRLQDPDAVASTPFGPIPVPPDRRRDRAGSDTTGPIDGGGGSDSGGSGTGTGGSGGPTAAVTSAGATAISGLGDVRIGLDARVLGGGSRLLAMDLELDVKAPTADDTLGTGEWDARFGMTLERRTWPGLVYGGVGWTRIGDPDWIDLEDAADVVVGFDGEPGARGLRWGTWAQAVGEIVPGAGAQAYLGGGVRGPSSRPFRVSAYFGLTRAAQDFGVTLGWSFGGATRGGGRRELQP